jgi:hypothetical protein
MIFGLFYIFVIPFGGARATPDEIFILFIKEFLIIQWR